MRFSSPLLLVLALVTSGAPALVADYSCADDCLAESAAPKGADGADGDEENGPTGDCFNCPCARLPGQLEPEARAEVASLPRVLPPLLPYQGRASPSHTRRLFTPPRA